MDKTDINPDNPVMERLLRSLEASTCNFLAVDTVKATLEESGFRQLRESDYWEIAPGDKCYVTKNGSAIFAFVAGSEPVDKAGVRIISAHTDSPCFKLKPNCEIYGDGGVVSLNVEKYGGPIIYTWFDRPLLIFGRVMPPGADPPRPVGLPVLSLIHNRRRRRNTRGETPWVPLSS